MPIILAADHGGYPHKQEIKTWLTKQGEEIIDAGALKLDPQDDFPDFAFQAITAFHQHPKSKILLWCRSGVGMIIAANRYPGIYCGFGLNIQQITNAIRDDHLNALVFASDFQPLVTQKLLITTFLHTPHSPHTRFLRRLKKIDRYPQKLP